jgi:hypothetical protein
VIYTDIEAPKPTTLEDDLTLGAIAISDEEGRDLIVPADLPLGDATSTYEMGEEFAGTYRGIAGTFECTSATCVVSLDEDGEVVIGSNDEFSFDPTNNSDTYDKPDAAYTYFGWWLNKPEKSDGVHAVDVFAGGAGTAALAPIEPEIEGTATYEGPAAGKYVTKTFSAGVQTDAAVGHFTATANLTADFGENTGNLGTIEGSIASFELDDGASPSWSVMLEEAELEADGTFSSSTEVNFGGEDTDSEVGGAGVWNGAFYDAAKKDADGPNTVIGTFDALTPNASVIGAFGAKKQ